jgi:uncharacterized protein
MAGNRHVLVDTGPVVAFLNRKDRFHQWAREQFGEISPPMLTCEAVITEACYLLRYADDGSQGVLALIDRGVMQIGFKLEEEILAIMKLLGRYSNVPISLADACLVRMTEQYPQSKILTLDHDFRIYRKYGRQIIPVVLPH